MTAHHHRQPSLLAPPLRYRHGGILDRERLQKLEGAEILSGDILNGRHVTTSRMKRRRVKRTEGPLYRRRRSGGV